MEDLARRKLEALYLAGEREIPKSRKPGRETPKKRAAPDSGTAAVRTPETALEELRREIGDCKRCRLCEGRTQLVFGVGNPHARLMFVGEAPGRDEDRQGEPFVGRAGKLLDKIIEAMKLTRQEVYIANVVKCLRYNAMVQLGDGSWERIGRLVRSQYKGTVMSLDHEGRLVPRSVTGWHESPLANRSVFKLTFQSAKYSSSHKCGIFLTGDHPVLTKRGYIPVQELKSDDLIATGQGFSKIFYNLLMGTLLGDAHISSKNAHLSFSHSIKQEEYCQFKANLLNNEIETSWQKLAVAAGGEQQYPIVRVRTKSHRALWIIRNQFYNTKKKVPDSLADMLNPMMLAFWFMDDGYLRIRPPRKPSAEIATCAFSDTDLVILISGLKKLGLNAYSRNGRIHFDTLATKELSKIIAPYVPSAMRYKLHPDVEPRIPFNKALFESKERYSLFDRVEVSPINFNGTDKTFFCIDVEETSNFVTSGGVVHNCRPPENRNPAPDEIETCEPFLLRQIEAIKPEIIVCLGTFAAQTLLQTETRIGALRSKFHAWPSPVVKAKFETSLPEGVIQVMPTYHPAFLLRNPNMKRPLWEDMQQVMTRLVKKESP